MGRRCRQSGLESAVQGGSSSSGSEQGGRSRATATCKAVSLVWPGVWMTTTGWLDGRQRSNGAGDNGNGLAGGVDTEHAASGSLLGQHGRRRGAQGGRRQSLVSWEAAQRSRCDAGRGDVATTRTGAAGGERGRRKTAEGTGGAETADGGWWGASASASRPAVLTKPEPDLVALSLQRTHARARTHTRTYARLSTILGRT